MYFVKGKLKLYRRIRIFCLILLISFIFIQPAECNAADINDYKGGNIIIALDVSGSMVNTDQDRLSIEMIQMMIDMASENDQLAVVAYNDFIVYQSGLISMNDQGNRDKLKQDVEGLVFSGETDNGLGLKTAVDLLAGQTNDEKQSYVIFISDGKTDLAKSKSERTLEQSEADWNTSATFAKDNKIQINTISFVNEYSQDTSQMTVISTQTGGTSNVVANPLQFIQAFTQTWLNYQGSSEVPINTENATAEISKAEFRLDKWETDEVLLLTIATQPYKEFEMLSANNQIQLYKNRHYALARIKNPVKEDFSAMYSCDADGILMWSMVDVGKKPEKPVKVKKKEKTTYAPVSLEAPEEDLYISKGAQKKDISSLFTDKDGDIVKYEIEVPNDAGIKANISGSMLEVEPVCYEDVEIKVTATDSTNKKAETELTFHCIPKWKENYTLIVTMVIAGIIAVTALICFVLWKFLFPHKKEKGKSFHGYLIASFIDLKSKNDIPKLQFDLRKSPGEGTTLKELMMSVDIIEDLPDTDKIYFYPYSKNEIVLSHDSYGGIFVEDEPLSRNTPVRIPSGTTIYVAFAENASEYELRYEAKGL